MKQKGKGGEKKEVRQVPVSRRTEIGIGRTIVL